MSQSLLKTYLKLSVRERQQRFVSTDDVARSYNVTRRTIQNWIEQKRIAAVRIGKKYQVDLRSVEAYFNNCAERDEAS